MLVDNHVFLLVDAGVVAAVHLAETNGVRAVVAQVLPGQTVLSARMEQYEQIRSWWRQGTSLRRTFGVSQMEEVLQR